MTTRSYLLQIALSMGLFFAALTLLFTGGCGYAKHLDPLLLTYPTRDLAYLSAAARATDINGVDANGRPIGLYSVANTHSMEPVLLGGDYIVVDTRVAFENVKVGQVVNYHAEWTPPPAPTVTHRAQVWDKDGLLVAGDNVRPDIDPSTGQDLHSEARYRVTKDRYVGVVDTIYRVKP